MTCLSRILASIPGGEILDVGCGTGDFTRLLATGTLRPRSVLGIDPDKDSIDEARRLTDDRVIRYRVMDLYEAPFRDARFDTVAAGNALHHFRDPLRALGEIRRLLRDDGVCVIREVISDGLSPAQANTRDIHHFKARIDTLRGHTHRETYTRESVVDLVVTAGLVVTESCCLDEDADPFGEDDDDGRGLERATAFLDEYLAFAESTPAHVALKAMAASLKIRIAASGLSEPPELVILARNPAAR
ncbi:MAG: SAM-dependent methyltransferase [Spirochaetales bacterium]|nr:MAG: SAM-dependent methyltransferase [Spirochaetales bacterium]